MNDKDVGLRFISGGEAALEEVINLYGGKLLRYATTILCDYQEAENVVQEVFIAAYQNRQAFDGNYLSAWLFKITYNRSINQLKKRKIFYYHEHEIKERRAALAEEAGFSEETLQALKRLKPVERALIYGRIMEEQSYEELSQLLHCSPATLRKKYERSKKKLAGYLAASPCGKESKHESI